MNLHSDTKASFTFNLFNSSVSNVVCTFCKDLGKTQLYVSSQLYLEEEKRKTINMKYNLASKKPAV